MSLFSWRRLAGLPVALLMAGVLFGTQTLRAEYVDAGEGGSELYTQEGQADAQFSSLATEALADHEMVDMGGGCGGATCSPACIGPFPNLRLLGRIQMDHLMASQSAQHIVTHGRTENRTRFDSVRLGVEGDVFENIGFRFEMAFGENGVGNFGAVAGAAANGAIPAGGNVGFNQNQNADRPVFKDMFLEVRELAILQNIRAGHMIEPFGLEVQDDNLHSTFMERSYLDTFVPGRNIGIMTYGHLFDDQTVSWYGGLFRGEMDDDSPDISEDQADWAGTARIALNPTYDEPSGGRFLTHAGASVSYREYGDNLLFYSKDHELNLLYSGANPINGFLLAEHTMQYGTEGGFVWGPLHGSGEWVHVAGKGFTQATNDFDYTAWYLQGGYFLTGEHRGYNKAFHRWDRVNVLEPVFAVRTTGGIVRGLGAIEAKIRYSYIDGNDVGANIGRAEGLSTGFNWYLCDYAKVMVDYIYAENSVTPSLAPANGVYGGAVQHLGVRGQIDW